MGLNEIQTWLVGVLAGGITLNSIISGINLFKGIFGGLKVSKLMNFTAVADKNIKDSQGIILALKEQFQQNAKEVFEQFKVEILEPMVKKVNLLETDNTMLAELSVTLLSLVNVPLDQKQQFFKVLSGIANVSEKAKTMFEASITSQESQQAVAVKTDNLISEKISNS